MCDEQGEGDKVYGGEWPDLHDPVGDWEKMFHEMGYNIKIRRFPPLKGQERYI